MQKKLLNLICICDSKQTWITQTKICIISTKKTIETNSSKKNCQNPKLETKKIHLAVNLPYIKQKKLDK